MSDTAYAHASGDAIHNISLPFDGVDPVSYDSTTDALGHETRTYQDGAGRDVGTIYDDGSYTATYYSNGSSALNAPQDWNPGRDGTWFEPTIPAGYSEVVKVAQRKTGSGLSDDPVLATIELYDPAGRLTDVWMPAAMDADPASPTHGQMVRPHWHYEYDARGNEISQTDPKGNVTSWTYDEKGNQTSRKLPPDSDGTTADDTESWTYDSFGRMLSHVDFKGQAIAYAYDNSAAAQGRLSAEYRFDAGAAALDGSGNIITSNAAEETAYGYDNLGRQSSVTEYANGNLTAPVRSTTTTFDPISGNVASVTSPEGTINYEYKVWASWRQLEGVDPDALEDHVKAGCELCVAVADQVAAFRAARSRAR